MDMTGHDLAATIDTCAYELRQVGDSFYWRYKLLEILLRNYHNVTKINAKYFQEKQFTVKVLDSQETLGRDVASEDPELIWNDDSRESVSTTVREMTLDHFKHQKDDPDVNWKLPEDFPVASGAGRGELQVGGVFQRIFIDYRLRKFHLPPFVFR
ncbi:hypothetical protein KUCAC02_033637 [Chaenocephalus aceratus]|nr:hypothetical protein KUCAC02_033637 [Chaenocephalus aceratus]